MADLSSLEQAARRLAEPDVTAAELAQIAGAHPELRALVASHPAAYPELRAWIQAAGGVPQATVEAVPVIATPQAAGGASPVATPPGAVGGTATARHGTSGWVPWAVAAVAVLVAAGSWLRPQPAGEGAASARAASTPVPTATSTSEAGGAATFAAAEGTFATPQDAVAFLAQRLAAGDAAGAATAFATTSMVDGYDFAAQLARMGAMGPYTWLPSSTPYYRTLDLGQRAAQITAQLRAMTWSVVDPQDDPTTTAVIGDASTAAALASRLDPAPMARLTVLHVDMVGVGRPQLATAFASMAAPYRADEYAEYAVLYGTPNGPMVGGVSFLRYGTRWLVFGLSSSFLGTDPGTLKAANAQDYATMIAPAQG